MRKMPQGFQSYQLRINGPLLQLLTERTCASAQAFVAPAAEVADVQALPPGIPSQSFNEWANPD